MQVITIGTTFAEDKDKFFFTTDHCQHHGLGNNYVPVTCRLPMRVATREGLENGIIETVEQFILVFHKYEIQIPNPNPDFEPEYSKFAKQL